MKEHQIIYFEDDSCFLKQLSSYVSFDCLSVNRGIFFSNTDNFLHSVLFVSFDYCSKLNNDKTLFCSIPFVICFDEKSDPEIDLLCEKAYYGYLSLPASPNRIRLSLNYAKKRWENERNEMRITKEHQFFCAIIDDANIWISVIDRDLRFLVWNKAAEEITGYSKDEVLGSGKVIEWLRPSKMHWGDVDKQGPYLFTDRSNNPYEIEILTKSEEFRNINLITKPIFDSDNGGNYLYTINIGIDVTDKLKRDSELELRLQEKDLLLKEIHHRVKNNLQIIMSLINLQVHNLVQAEVKTMFKDTQDRVRSMALIHERLYKSENIAHIDIADYINALCNEIFRSFQVDTQKIKLNISAESVFFDINIGIPLGLIINEIVTNSIKYAFVGRDKAEISVSLKFHDDQFVKLEISDNGVGLPAHFKVDDASTLGMQIICNLADQIGAKLIVESENGTLFELLIPYQSNINAK